MLDKLRQMEPFELRFAVEPDQSGRMRQQSVEKTPGAASNCAPAGAKT